MSSEPYTLYHNPKQVYSLMVRYTLAVSQSVKSASSKPVILEHPISFTAGDHLKENYLLHINPKGQIPVLTHPTLLSKPIVDALDITTYFFTFFPNLCPSPFKSEVSRLLSGLHAINFFSLSYGTQPQMAKGQEMRMVNMISAPGISPEYKKALEYKLEIFKSEKLEGVEPATVAAEEARTDKFLAEISAARTRSAASGSPWVLGTEEPTALDAHLVVFLARLCDLKREHMLDDVLMEYVTTIKDSETWQALTKGESTI